MDKRLFLLKIVGMADEKKLAELIKIVQENGYRVTKEVVYVKKTFDVDRDTLQKVNVLRVKLNLTLRDAFNEALQLWVVTKK